MATAQVHVRTNVEPDIRRMARAVHPEPHLRIAGERKVSRMVRILRTSGEPAEGQPPVSRSGSRGFAGRFTATILHGGRVLRYGNASVTARILALGGVIRPRKRKYLTVPIAKEAQGKRARDFKHTFIRMSAAGNLIIFQRRGKKLVALFVLKDKVTIRPHPWGYEWDAVDNAGLRKTLTAAVAKAERERAS